MRQLTAGGIVLAVCVLASCGSVPAPVAGGSTPGTGPGALSQRELRLADQLARREAKQEGATLSSATATVATGTQEEMNTGHPCTSGRMLYLKLIGDFPHAVVAPVQ